MYGHVCTYIPTEALYNTHFSELNWIQPISFSNFSYKLMKPHTYSNQYYNVYTIAHRHNVHTSIFRSWFITNSINSKGNKTGIILRDLSLITLNNKDFDTGVKACVLY